MALESVGYLKPASEAAASNNNNPARALTGVSLLKGRLLRPNRSGGTGGPRSAAAAIRGEWARLRELESSLVALVLDSCRAREQNQAELALARAREALESLGKLRGALAGCRERQPLTGGLELFELALMVNCNLGAQLKAAGQCREALELYTSLCRLASSPGASTGASGHQKPAEQQRQPTQSSNNFDSNFNFNFNFEQEAPAAPATGSSSLTNQTQLTVGGLQFNSSASPKSNNSSSNRSLLHKFGLNIGNVYYQLNDFKRSLKYYRLTLDRLSSMANLVANSERSSSSAIESMRASGRTGQREGEHHDIRQLKLKLMNNISLALHKQRQALADGEERITSLQLLLADNLVSARARQLAGRRQQEASEEDREQQQVARPAEAESLAAAGGRLGCLHADHPTFALNLMLCLAATSGRPAEELRGALSALARVELPHHFRRCLLPERGGERPPPAGERSSAHTDGRQSTTGIARLRSALGRLASDRLEGLIGERRKLAERSLLLACKLLQEAAQSELERSRARDFCRELLSSSPLYRHLLRDLELSEALAAGQRSGRHLNKLAQLLLELDSPAGPPEERSEFVSAAAALSKVSKHHADKPINFSETRELAAADTSGSWPINLANCFLIAGELSAARQIYESNSNSWQAHYNLAIVKRLAGENSSVPVDTKLLLGSRNSLLRLISRGMYLSALQAALASSQEDQIEVARILEELTRNGQEGPEVVLLAARLAGREGEEPPERDNVNRSNDKSSQLLQQANRKFPYHLPLLERLIALNINNFDYKTARELIVNCIKNRPDQVRWYQMLGECYRREANYEKASRMYKLAIERFPQDTSCLRALIKLADELGLSEERRLYEAKLAKLAVG